MKGHNNAFERDLEGDARFPQPLEASVSRHNRRVLSTISIEVRECTSRSILKKQM